MTQPEPRSTAQAAGLSAATSESTEQDSKAHRLPKLGNVYFRQPGHRTQARRASWLARRLGLELYASDRLLTRRVRTELTILAAVLLVVFFFELTAWSFFFNGLFSGDVTRFHPWSTPVAVLPALLFAATTLYFERQVLTTDTRGMKWLKKAWAQFIRILAIAVGGFIVAHAVDLLAFGDVVEKSLYSKAVAQHVESLGRDIDAIPTETDEPHTTRIAEDRAELRDRIEMAQERRELAAADVERSRSQVDGLKEEVGRRGNDLDTAKRRLRLAEQGDDRTALSAAQDAVDSARRRYEEAQSRLRAATAEHRADQATLHQRERLVQSLEDQRSMLREREVDLSDQADQNQAAISDLQSRLRRWEEELLEELDQGKLTEREEHVEEWPGLQDASADQKQVWPARWREPLRFYRPSWHFFERIAVVYKLAFGEMDDRSTGRSPSPAVEVPRAVYFWSWLGIHLMAIFVPFFVFTVKWFLMPKEVEIYYSTRHQAEAGDPEARMVLNVDEKVRRMEEP